MAWVRIHDGAMQNLKITSLSDSAFRLWVRGLCYCQTALTDGLIPRSALRDMGAKRKDVDQLSTPQVEGRAPLWEPHDIGFKVHDYLAWNDCRDKVVERQTKAKQRKDEWSERRRERKPNASQNAFRTRQEQDSGSHTTKPNQTNVPATEQPVGDASSKRPIFSGQRFAVFEWQLEGLERLLGRHYEAFDLHAWFFDLDAQAVKSQEVIPQRDNGQWLQARTLTEAKRRGLPIASPSAPLVAGTPEAQAEAVRQILKSQGVVS